jgi:hypothetical protein
VPSPTIDAAVTGRVLYYRSGIGVSDVSLVTAPNSEQRATTDAGGRYRLAGLLPGRIEIVASKQDGRNRGISASDAAYVLQALAHDRELDATERVACDADGNRRIDRRDVEQILDLAIGARDHLDIATTCATDWFFANRSASNPGGSPMRECSPAAAVDVGPGDVQQDFDAILLGDCNGDWQHADAGTADMSTNENARVTIGPWRRARRHRLRLPIVIDATTEYTAAEIHLTFDAGALRPLRIRPHRRGVRLFTRLHADDAGRLTIAVASAEPRHPDQPLTLLLELAMRNRNTAPAPPVVIAARVDGT